MSEDKAQDPTPTSVASLGEGHRAPKPSVHDAVVRFLRQAHTWLFAFGCLPWICMCLVLFGVAALTFMARDVDRAPFRLNVETAFLWVVVGHKSGLPEVEAGHDHRLAIESSAWEIKGFALLDHSPEWLSGIVSMRSADKRNDKGYRATFDLRPGDQINLEVSSTSAKAPTQSIVASFPLRSVPVRIEVVSTEDEPAIPIAMNQSSDETMYQTVSSVDVSVGGPGDSWLRLDGFTEPQGRSTRLRISGIGFTQNEGVARSGVASGTLYFLDNPASEMKIFRGTDLRLTGSEMTIESLHATGTGFTITLSGMASSALIQLGASGEGATVSIMPTYFDRAQRKPILTASIALITILSGVLGTLFAAAAVFDRVGHRIGAKPPS